MKAERSVVALREKAVYIGLGVPVFVTIAGVAEEAVVAESFQIPVFDAGQVKASLFCGKTQQKAIDKLILVLANRLYLNYLRRKFRLISD